MARLVGILLSGIFLCILVSQTAWAQATAQISGTVKDSTGAVLPGAEVTAAQTDTGINRSTVTNETGSYVLPNLPLGPYRLQATLPGFQTYVQTGLVLQVNDNLVINASLQVGQVSQQVEVQANAAFVETRSTGIGQVIENQRILELPLNGRQATDLITLSGAAVQTAQSGADKDRTMGGSVPIAVGGGFYTGTAYLLDGAMHNDPWNNLNLPLPFPDALQEFKVETGTLSAQSGQYSGAAVNSVTKSGTNDFHGDLFEFVRNDLFNARNYFAVKQSTLKRNQFGGTAGGPIIKNKLFFFGGYQGTTVRQDPANLKSFVPTDAMLDGDFTAFASPACNSGRQIALRAPFSNNRVDSALLSKAALALSSRLPKASDPCGLVTYGIPISTNEGQFVGKVDYQFSAKQTVFGRYLATHFTQPVPYTVENNLLNTTSLGFDNLAQSFAFGDTYLIGPNKVNSFRLAVNRTAINRVGANFISSPTELGIKATNYNAGEINVQINGTSLVSANYGPNRTTTEQMSDDLSIVHGTHQIAFGGSLAQWRNNLNAQVFSKGYYSFNGQTTGLALADFLIGKMNQFMQTPPNQTYMSEWSFGLYATDTWKATPRFTVNYGLRWEPFIPQTLRNGIISTFDEGRYASKTQSTVFNNAPFGFYYPGDRGFAGTSCRSSGICNATGMESRWGKFGPRLGFAWDPKGDGYMSIRASYGLAYDTLTADFYTTFISPPWTTSIIVPNPRSFEDPWGTYPGGNPFPIAKIDANIRFQPNANYFVVPSNPTPTQRHSWNLSIQRQLGTDWLLSTSYIGNHAVHVWSARELNPGLYIPGASTTANRDSRRRLALTYPSVGGTPIAFLDQYEPGATQSYNGLLISVQRRAAKGVIVAANYTLSHCITDWTASQTGGGGTPGSTYLDPNNRHFDRGNCDVDRRHIFNMTAVAETPRFANDVVRKLGSGWRLSGIYRQSSGSPINITSGIDVALNGVQNQRPQQVFGNAYGIKSLTNYLNPAAFTFPAPGTLGNMGRNTLFGPGIWQLDAALSRVFTLREAQKVEARVEAFNVTNTFRPGQGTPSAGVGAPVTNLSSGSFGQINLALDPRLLQFSLKYIF
jgi:hypothetical protein